MNIGAQVSLEKRELFVGIDGGGTKTLASIGCHIDGRLCRLGAGQGGASNPRAVGFELAFDSITQAVQSAFASAKIEPQACVRAVLCIAGAGRDQEKSAIEAWAARSRLAHQIRLVSEAEAVLAAVDSDSSQHLQKNPVTAEIALICGTGSLAWGRIIPSDSNDSIGFARAGGWGYLLGDEGSGFWIGQKLLQLACLCSDQRISDDRLLSAVLKHLQLASASELIPWCYGSSDSRDRIAAMAPIAFELLEVERVTDIIHAGAESLAAMIGSVVRQLDVSNYSLALAGSVVLKQPEYLQLIIGCLNQAAYSPQQYVAVAEPVLGALRLASQTITTRM